jgi:cell division protein FtsL
MTKVIALWIVLVAFAGAAFAQTETPTPAAPPADARAACTRAMNADPTFAASIVKIADEKAQAQRDADTVAAHTDAYAHVQKNEKHVIYAYAAMWIVAAGFVIFLWRRQQVLQLEIASLRRDLEAAAAEVPAGKGLA